jgi:hypothetical protein
MYIYIYILVFQDRVSLCSPGCPGTNSVDQAGLELRNPPASASQVLGLKVCATTARQNIKKKKKKNHWGGGACEEVLHSRSPPFKDKVSIISPSCPGARDVDQDGLKLPEIHLPLWTKGWGLKAFLHYNTQPN